MPISQKSGILCLMIVVLVACQSSPTKDATIADEASMEEQASITPNNTQKYSPDTIEKEGIRLISLPPMQDSKAVLDFSPTESKELGSGINSFQFSAENYQLEEGGSSLQLILNNEALAPVYESPLDVELAEGNNVLLAFLTDAEGRSVKEANSFYFQNLEIGERLFPFDLSAPHLIYHQPRGEFLTSDRVLVDFYLLNAALKEGELNVLVSIDDLEFRLASWQAYQIEGLESGEHTVRLQLIDRKGEVVFGPFNDSGARRIKING